MGDVIVHWLSIAALDEDAGALRVQKVLSAVVIAKIRDIFGACPLRGHFAEAAMRGVARHAVVMNAYFGVALSLVIPAVVLQLHWLFGIRATLVERGIRLGRPESIPRIL